MYGELFRVWITYPITPLLLTCLDMNSDIRILKLVVLVRSSWVKAIAAKLNDLNYIPQTQVCHTMRPPSSPPLISNLAGASACPHLYLQKKKNSEIVVLSITRPGVVLVPSRSVAWSTFILNLPHVLKNGCLQLFVVIGNHLFAKVGGSFTKCFIWYEEHKALELHLGNILAYQNPQIRWMLLIASLMGI